MQKLLTSSISTVSMLALATALAPASALAQTTPPETPPGASESSQQDDDPSASPAADQDTAATAAETATPLDTGSGDNAIVVTGSRIARPEFSFPNPIQSYGSESIQQAGVTNLTNFLLDSPALRGSVDNQQTAGSNLPNAQYVSLNLLDLRNLGYVRTLVLVDGRRHIAGYPGQAAVDINSIPVDLIDRIDILTGGTSAIYGADGVSGVVNFVMKKDFEGLSIRAQSGISQRGDAGNRFLTAVYGKNFADGRGNVAVAYQYNKADRFSQRQRLDFGNTGPHFRLVANPADRTQRDENGNRIDDPNIPDQVFLTDLRWIASSPGSAVNLDLDYYPDFTGEGTPYDRGTPVRGTPFTIGGDSTPQDSYFGDFTPFNRTHIFNLLAHYEVSPAFRLFVEGKYVRAKATTLEQPSFDFFTLLLPDNAFLNQKFGPQIADLQAQCAADPNDDQGLLFCGGGNYLGALISGRDNFDFGIRQAFAKRKTIRTVLGADGKLNDHLRYEVSWTYGRAQSDTLNTHDRLTDRYFAALDAVVDPSTGQVTCRINLPGETLIQGFSASPDFRTGFPGTMAPVTFQPGECVPLNVLGNGSPSQAALDWVLASHGDHAVIKQNVLNGYVSGDTGSFFQMPGGPIGFALGAEYRKESSRTIPDQLSQQGLLADYSTTAPEIGSFSVKEAFAEINIPILAKVPLAETLSIGAAGRISDYTTVGVTKTWSANAVYAPVRDVTFRGTYSRAARAPNINELFAGAAGGFFFVADPCGIDLVDTGSATREANCAAAISALGFDPATFDPNNDQSSPANSSIQGLVGSNRNLDEETAKTWTAGVVFRPRFIPGLNLALDWYDITIKNAINTPTATELVALCYDAPTLQNQFCDAIHRDPLTGFVDDFTIVPSNVASFDTSGLDVAFNYRFAPFTDGGTFNFKLNANYLHKLTFISIPGAEIDDDRGEAFKPKYSATADLTWTKGPWTVNYGVNWYSKTWRTDQNGLQINDLIETQPDIVEKRFRKYKAYWDHQAQVSLDVDRKMNFYLGVNNLWDEKPDIGAVGYPHDAIGRFFYAGVRLKPF
jgi:outer membrane receptor protein involved in Fe transport